MKSFSDYEANQDLHIGLTDNNGNLIEFNENGLQFGTSVWSECFKLGSIQSLVEDYSIERHNLKGDHKSTDDCQTKGSLSTHQDACHSTNSSSSINLFNKSPSTNCTSTNCTLTNCTSTNCTLTNCTLTNCTSTNSLTNSSTNSSINSLTNSLTTNHLIKNFLLDNSSANDNPSSDDCSTNSTKRSKTTRTSNKSEDTNQLVEYWNYTIAIVRADRLIGQKFNSRTYDQLRNNCLDFVFFFFGLLDLDPFTKLNSKIEFCDAFIKPRLVELFRIIEFSRECSSNQYLVIDRKLVYS